MTRRNFLCIFILGLLLSPLTTMAATPIMGFREAKWGGSVEAVRRAFPQIRQDSIIASNWICDVEVPHLYSAEATFRFGDHGLESVQIEGVLANDGITAALREKYGTASTVDSEDRLWVGHTDIVTWTDAQGNRLKCWWFAKSPDCYMEYASADKARRDDMEAKKAKQAEKEKL